jgi:subtilisin family serine protease
MTARDGLMDRIEYSEKFDASRVRVAVLDTGIDWNDPLIRGAKERIVEWKNWAGDREDQAPDSPHPVHDEAGHGTHITALLLKIAPEAKVFIGRVADRNGAMVAAEKIAEVSFLNVFGAGTLYKRTLIGASVQITFRIQTDHSVGNRVRGQYLGS